MKPWRAVLLLGLLGASAHAQSLLGHSAPGQPASTAPMPAVLTPLGPLQSAPPQAPPSQSSREPTVVPPPAPIQSQQLPVLTPPSPGEAPSVQTPAVQTPPTQPSPTQPPTTQSPAAPTPPATAAPVPAIQTPTPQPPNPSAPVQTPVPLSTDWQPRDTVVLQALDKVTARSTTLTGKVGTTLHFESLSIAVKACVARPPDQPPDSAAYLDITDSHPNGPGFHGWILAAEPSVSMLQHPLYGIRLTDCQ